ncbi:winged helix-turn-helix transcriptional regulator [Streptomyces sp. NPDC058256]|uniref:winged helix-turn-helix transcriptional regulator n=1 Tax=Streptomyces sp. NPDC058256 TaxID=3346408 RepID=UPI0036F0FA49
MSRRPRRSQDDGQKQPADEDSEQALRRSQGFFTPNDDQYVRRIHDVRHLASGEWSWDVLVTLHKGPLQYVNLLNAIRAKSSDTGWPGRKHRWLQDSPLNRTLRRLEQGELVRRSRETQFPYHATYELSQAAEELLLAAAPFVAWAETHTDLLDRARQRRHSEGATNH